MSDVALQHMAWSHWVRSLVSTAACAGVLAGCGSGSLVQSTERDGSLDVTMPAEAGSSDVPGQPPEEGAVLVMAPLTCDGGYFVEIDDDAGRAWLATSGCGDAGPPVPTFTQQTLCGEDCFCSMLVACSGSATVRMSSYCWTCMTGACSVPVVSIGDDGGALQGTGLLRIASFPDGGGDIAGTFAGSVALPLDGGLESVSGRFCVRYER